MSPDSFVTYLPDRSTWGPDARVRSPASSRACAEVSLKGVMLAPSGALATSETPTNRSPLGDFIA